MRMSGHTGPSPHNSPNELNLTPYAGRWVALVRGGVAGVGGSAEEARRAAQLSRPKEKPELRFVTVDDWQDSHLLRRLWAVIRRHHADALLVGGAVRDGLLGRPLQDFDFTVDGDATALAAAVGRDLCGALVPLDQERDMARVVFWDTGSRYYADFSRRQGDDWNADLRARDFTVNAIAVRPDGQYLDPLGGRGDLAAGLLRAASEPAFRDDPLRTLRAVRLSAELGLAIEAQTVDWIERDASLLPRAAAERIRNEFARILGAQSAVLHLQTLDALGLLTQILPELMTTKGVKQSPPHQWDVWSHTRMTVQAVEEVLAALEGAGGAIGELDVPGWVWEDLVKRLGALQPDLVTHLGQVVSDVRDRRFTLRLSALLHDIGKPHTRSLGDEGRIHFYNHEVVGAELAAERLRALRFSGDEVALVHTIILNHLRPGHLAQAKKGPTRRAIYRYYRATEGAGVEVALLSLADMLATWGPALPGQLWLRRLNVVATLLTAYFDRWESVAPPPLINGHQLMAALALEPGPEVGRLLEAVREAQAAGKVTSGDEALALAKQLQRDS
jgi:putative nucleotidyltransferase with HDIG domain